MIKAMMMEKGECEIHFEISEKEQFEIVSRRFSNFYKEYRYKEGVKIQLCTPDYQNDPREVIEIDSYLRFVFELIADNIIPNDENVDWLMSQKCPALTTSLCLFVLGCRRVITDEGPKIISPKGNVMVEIAQNEKRTC
jgi:hypothetical protein